MKPTVDHLLVASDFTAASSAAIEYAATLARGLRAHLHLVHVLEQPFVASGPHELVLPDTPARREERYRAAFARLSRDAKVLADGVTASVEIREGEATHAIAQAAVDYGADLIVLGTRGHRGLRHLFDDRVDRLTRIAGRPILTVRELDGARATAAAADPQLAA